MPVMNHNRSAALRCTAMYLDAGYIILKYPDTDGTVKEAIYNKDGHQVFVLTRFPALVENPAPPPAPPPVMNQKPRPWWARYGIRISSGTRRR